MMVGESKMGKSEEANMYEQIDKMDEANGINNDEPTKENCSTCKHWGQMKGRNANYCPIEHTRTSNLYWCSQWEEI